MQAVISAAQAREITGGRAPLIPVEYERALVALRQCQQIDDTKYWADKADALAAWAKIYHSNEADRQARALKLHAYRRMGELARELRPVIQRGCMGGSSDGPISLLKENGLNQSQASSATRLAKLPQDHFDSLVNSPRPPAPSTTKLLTSNSEFSRLSSKGWTVFSAFCRDNKPSVFAGAVSKSDRKIVKRRVHDMIEWLDEVERLLK